MLLGLVVSCASNDGRNSEQGFAKKQTIGDHLKKARYQVANGKNKSAMASLEKAMNLCDLKFANRKKKLYTSRSQTESLYYLTKAAVEGTPAVIEHINCSDVQYLSGYVHIELEQWASARQNLETAVAMAPVNALYLIELAHYHQVKKRWKKSMEYYKAAEQYAVNFSPDDVKSFEIRRAKRGVGYNLFELGDLPAAAEKYKECLKIDTKDKRAKAELAHIDRLLRLQE